MKDLQRICDPIIASIYNSAGAQGGYDDDDEEFEDLWTNYAKNKLKNKTHNSHLIESALC